MTLAFRNDIQPIKRRRFLKIVAAMAGMGGLGQTAWARHPAVATNHVWEGVALGADARLEVIGMTAERARAIFTSCETRLRELEAVFSLFEPESAISRLNREGLLSRPPRELVEVLNTAKQIHTLTNGAFDPTIQPLWLYYADHFWARGRSRDELDQNEIARLTELVDFNRLEISAERIAFKTSGSAITLNGIAQGFITDEIVSLLKVHGVSDTLVNMGEYYALGQSSRHSPWRLGLGDPIVIGQTWREIELADKAVATSSPMGSRFDPQGGYHHLLDPRSGKPANHHQTISVIAETAALADGLSTALSTIAPDDIASILKRETTIEVLGVDRFGRKFRA